MNFFFSLISIITAGLFLIIPPLSAEVRDRIKVQVSILPQKYFVEQIAGDLASVGVLVKPGKNPSTYSPSPDQIKQLASSDIYFRIGVAFENGFMHKIESIAKGIKVVDTRQGITLRDMDTHSKKSHVHDHGHQGRDPHIWLSPVLVKQQALTIFTALSGQDPDNKKQYEDNYHEFIGQLDLLHQKLTLVMEPFYGKSLFVFHPSFGYFAQAYGMEQIAVETMGKAPKGRELSAIIKKAKKEDARVIFVQPQFDMSAAASIAAAIKGVVVSIDPLAYDYPANMENIAQTISNSLRPQIK